MSVPLQTLVGKRVLIVEDEALVAFLLEASLEEFGCIPVGPCFSVAKALEAVGTETFDLAVLDVNLNGEKVYPVAYALAERHIPFLFVSGYGIDAIPPGRSGWKVCVKPFKIPELAAMLLTVMLEGNTANDHGFAASPFPPRLTENPEA
jgi:DNA-binding response OmpR family regulator